MKHTVEIYKFIDRVFLPEDEELRVPHSELARHLGIAGAVIQRITIMSPKWAKVNGYKLDPKTYQIESVWGEGSPTEVIPIDFINKTELLKEAFSIAEGHISS